MLLGAGVDVVWLFLGTNEKTPDSFQKRSRQQTKVTTYPQDQFDESGSIRGLLEAYPCVVTHCLTVTQVTAQAAPSRVPCATCHPVDRRVFSPPNNY